MRPHDPTAAAIATAIVIGDRAGLDPALEKRLQMAGTYHVIAISGGNIAVLTVVLLACCRLVGIPAALAGPLVAAMLVLHAGLVGGGASVARATTMAVIYLGLRAFDQSAWSLNALAAAVVCLVTVRPLSVVDPGLVLSVGATAAIIVLAARGGRGPAGSAWWRTVVGVMAASLATELVLLPVSAAFFNRVTVAGLLLNLAAVPLMAVVQIAASLTVLAHPAVPSAASAFGVVTAWAAHGLAATRGPGGLVAMAGAPDAIACHLGGRVVPAGPDRRRHRVAPAVAAHEARPAVCAAAAPSSPRRARSGSSSRRTRGAGAGGPTAVCG